MAYSENRDWKKKTKVRAYERLRTEKCFALFKRRRPKKDLPYYVTDDTTKRILGEFDTLAKAEHKFEELLGKAVKAVAVLLLFLTVSGTAQAQLVTNREKIDKLIDEFCMRFNVEPTLAKDIAMAESTYDPTKRAPDGGRGLWQFMPGTWDWATKELYGKRIDFKYAFNERVSTEVAVWYLSWIKTYLLKKGHYNEANMIVGYNEGVGKLRKHKYEPPKTHKNLIYRRYYEEYWRGVQK